MELTSPAFGNNQPIPAVHTVKGAGTSPPLMVSNIPPGTQCLAIIMHDPDAPGKDFTHWTVWNISGTANVLPEGRVPTGALQGLNDFGRQDYGPPNPPSGSHRYVFELYALNSQLSLPAGADVGTLRTAMENRTLATAQLTGMVSANA